MDAGNWASQNADFRKAWQENPASLTMPGGESLSDVQDRAVGALNRITGLYPSGSTLLLCSHNFVNLTLLCYASEFPSIDFGNYDRKPHLSISFTCKDNG